MNLELGPHGTMQFAELDMKMHRREQLALQFLCAAIQRNGLPDEVSKPSELAHAFELAESFMARSLD